MARAKKRQLLFRRVTNKKVTRKLRANCCSLGASFRLAPALTPPYVACARTTLPSYTCNHQTVRSGLSMSEGDTRMMYSRREQSYWSTLPSDQAGQRRKLQQSMNARFGKNTTRGSNSNSPSADCTAALIDHCIDMSDTPTYDSMNVNYQAKLLIY